jgi:hypothetical protein
MNVKINLIGLEGESEPASMLAEANTIQAETKQLMVTLAQIISGRAGF